MCVRDGVSGGFWARGKTYARELDAAVTALGSGALLLDVQVPELAAGGPDHADLVGDGVVPGRAVLVFLSCILEIADSTQSI